MGREEGAMRLSYKSKVTVLMTPCTLENFPETAKCLLNRALFSATIFKDGRFQILNIGDRGGELQALK